MAAKPDLRYGSTNLERRNAMQPQAAPIRNNHLQIVVAEGKVTLQDLHAALDKAIQVVAGHCNCGLTGFDVSFLRGNPAQASLAEVSKITNIQGAVFAQGA
jgi:hypothetical protein